MLSALNLQSEKHPMAPIILLGIIYVSFISIGLPDAVMGTAWPAVRETFGQPLEALSGIVIAFTISGALSGFAGGPVLKRLGTGPVAAISCALTSLALIGFAISPSFVWLIVLAVPMGLGCGAVDSGLNNFVAQHYSARHMNWLHGFWGVGVTLGPLILGAAMAGDGGWRRGALTLGLMQLVLTVVLFSTLRLWRHAPPAHAAHAEATASDAAPAYSRPLAPRPLAVWLAPLTFFVYVAAEGSVGLWLASILVGSRQFTPAQAGVWVSVYFGAIMTGRFAVGLVTHHFGNRQLVRLGIAVSLSGALLFALNGPSWMSFAALALTGLGFAPIYPSLMHETARRFAPDLTRVVIGRQAGSAYIGAAFLPPALGVLAAWAGLPVVIPTIAALLLVLLAITEALNRLT
jgi:fucose permease